MATPTTFELRKLTAALGAEVGGVDLGRPLAPETAAELRRALVEHGVIFFRDQDLSPQQFWAFLENFGRPEIQEGLPMEGAGPEQVQTADLLPTKHTTAVWHADTTFLARPPVATALRALQLPPFGGDTCWSSMYAAYDTLSEPLRDMLDGLTAVHSIQPILGRMAEYADVFANTVGKANAPEQVHPVVLRHPETGRKALYVSEGWTTRVVELSPAESATLLALLFEHVKRPDLTLRWKWSPNDMAFWDNRAVQHYAVPDYSSERVMQRIVLEGFEPSAFGAARAGA